tara:strand:+ start:201 stop:413 length:213 start_codon:yes stop_codon:yes gene_type:complete
MDELQNKISMIKRQTDYDEEKIKQKLQEHDNNVEKIIMEYHGIDLEKKEKDKFSNMTNNQKIFKSIRDFF